MAWKSILAVGFLSFIVGSWAVANESDTPVRVAPERTPYREPSGTREATNLPENLDASKELEELKILILNEEIPREQRLSLLNLFVKVERMQAALEMAKPIQYLTPSPAGFAPALRYSPQPAPAHDSEPSHAKQSAAEKPLNLPPGVFEGFGQPLSVVVAPGTAVTSGQIIETIKPAKEPDLFQEK